MTCRSKSWLQDFHRIVFLQQGTVLGLGDSLFARGSNHPTACSLCCPHIWSTPPLVMHLEDHSYLWGSHWKVIHLILIDRARWVIMAFCSPFRWLWIPPSEEIYDSLCLRYEWSLTNTSQTCNCAATLTVCHAMVCHMGGFRTTEGSVYWVCLVGLHQLCEHNFSNNRCCCALKIMREYSEKIRNL